MVLPFKALFQSHKILKQMPTEPGILYMLRIRQLLSCIALLSLYYTLSCVKSSFIIWFFFSICMYMYIYALNPKRMVYICIVLLHVYGKEYDFPLPCWLHTLPAYQMPFQKAPLFHEHLGVVGGVGRKRAIGNNRK